MFQWVKAGYEELLISWTGPSRHADIRGSAAVCQPFAARYAAREMAEPTACNEPRGLTLPVLAAYIYDVNVEFPLI